MPTLVSHAKVEIVDRVIRMFRNAGFTIEHKHYNIESLGRKPEAGVVHMIWGCPYDDAEAREIGKRPDIFWCENGWLTQQSGCYVDPMGTNQRSSLVGAINENSPMKAEMVKKRLADIHEWNKIEPQGTCFEGPHFAYYDYIFVPLQTECDTQVRFQPGIPAEYPYRQAWMLQRIVEAFTPKKILIRPHPRWPNIIELIDKYDPTILSMPNVEVVTTGNSYQWASRASAVACMNSTCVIEALTFAKPVATFGNGVFTGNGVCLELANRIGEVDELLPTVEQFVPDTQQLIRFFTLLFERQISYHDHSAEHMKKYPVLMQMVDYAKNGVANAA